MPAQPLATNAISFMDLPPELRNNICKMVLTQTVDHFLCSCETTTKSMETIRQQPALTRVSKAIRAETLPVFYGSNTFRVCMIVPSARQASLLWLRSIGASNCMHLLDLRATCCSVDSRYGSDHPTPVDVKEYFSFAAVIAKAEGFVSTESPYMGYTRVVFEGDAGDSN